MKLSQTEWQIMNALWQSYPATARELMEKLPKEVNWAYTTVKTMLARLVVKKAVRDSKRGNTSVYEPLISQKKARRSAFTTFLNQSFDGAVEPMLHFMVKDKKLSPKDRQKLMEILKAEEKKEKEA